MASRAQYASAEGVYLGWMTKTVAPNGAVEVDSEPPEGAHDARWIDKQWQRPTPRYFVDPWGKSYGWYSGWGDPGWEGAVEVEPPDHGLDTYDHKNKRWIDYAEKYKLVRSAEYQKLPIGDQIDAIYKFAIGSGLVAPDISKPIDTPEGWVARISKIKQDNPKPE